MKHVLRNPKHWLYVVCHLVLILLGFLLCQGNSNTVWFAVGSSMIAAGITGWVVFVYVLVTEDVSEKLKVLSEFGVVNVFDARSVVIKREYVKRLEAARDQIAIIGFGLSALREDFLGEFSQWKQRANVRILLLDPEFPSTEFSLAAQRDREEKNPEGQIASDVRKFIEDVGPQIGKSGKREFSIRLYRCLPTLNIFLIDDELFWGPYLLEEQSRNSPTFLVKRGGILFDRLSRQFDRIWQNNQLSRLVHRE